MSSPTTRHSREHIDAQLYETLRRLRHYFGQDAPCTDCEFFKVETGKSERGPMTVGWCTHWQSVPPPATIVSGCDMFIGDIPF